MCKSIQCHCFCLLCSVVAPLLHLLSSETQKTKSAQQRSQQLLQSIINTYFIVWQRQIYHLWLRSRDPRQTHVGHIPHLRCTMGTLGAGNGSLNGQPSDRWQVTDAWIIHWPLLAGPERRLRPSWIITRVILADKNKPKPHNAKWDAARLLIYFLNSMQLVLPWQQKQPRLFTQGGGKSFVSPHSLSFLFQYNTLTIRLELILNN